MYTYHSLSYIVKTGIVKFIFLLAGGQCPPTREFSGGMGDKNSQLLGLDE